MKLVWHGPAGAETIYPADAKFEKGATEAKPLFEGWLEPGKTTLDLPDDHPQALAWKKRGWLLPPAEAEAKTEPKTDAEKAPEKAADKKHKAAGAAEQNGAH